jgi:hypothetical protein
VKDRLIKLSLPRLAVAVLAGVMLLPAVASAGAFEGCIQATCVRGGQAVSLLYSAGSDSLRVENTDTNWPSPINLLDRNTGVLTLLFSNNRTFIHLPSVTENPAMPGSPQMPALPPGIGPQSQPGMPNAAAAGGMPTMPMPPAEPLELKPTGETTNLLGYTCAGYEIKQRGETMVVWATDQLLPFQAWQQTQSPRAGHRPIEDQWAELMKTQKLFPFLATLKRDHASERYRFEVKSITAQKFTDTNTPLFRVPAGYLEIQPLPF